MTQLYSARLGEAHNTAAGAITLFTVPPGFLYVVRSIDSTYDTAPSSSVILRDGSGNALWRIFYSAQQSNWTWVGHQAFPAGDTLTANGNTTSATYTRVSGYVLTAP